MLTIQAIFISQLAFSCVAAFVVTLVCIILIRPIAIKLKLQDLPGGRKLHKLPTPVIGGVCMFLGFCFALLTFPHSLEMYRGFLGASALLVFVGILDDMHELSARSRFAAQILAALMMIFWGHTVLHSFGNLLFIGNINLGYLAVPITVFATVGAINAVNMLDGVDGLLGSVILVQFAFLAYLTIEDSHSASLNMVLIIIAIVSAYLLFNFPFKKQHAAKVFMGDAGSMFLGFAVTWFFINLSQNDMQHVAPVTMVWIFAVPLFDTTWLLFKRTQRRSNPLAPGRDHLHHLLQEAGLSDRSICFFISAITFIFALVGVITMNYHIDQSTQFVCLVGLFVLYCFVVNFSWTFLVRQQGEKCNLSI